MTSSATTQSRFAIAMLFTDPKLTDAISDVLPRHMNPTRFLRVSVSAILRDESLLRCTHESLCSAVLDAAKIGLEPTGRLGGAYLVPSWNGRKGVNEARVQTDYRGDIALVVRAGYVSEVDAYLIHEADTYEQVSNRSFRHRPATLRAVDGLLHEVSRGAVVGVYAEAVFRSGFVKQLSPPLTRADVEAYRARSQMKDRGPWVTDWDAMAMKTAIRRLCDKLPKSAEYQAFLMVDDPDVDLEDAVDGGGSRSEAERVPRSGAEDVRQDRSLVDGGAQEVVHEPGSVERRPDAAPDAAVTMSGPDTTAMGADAAPPAQPHDGVPSANCLPRSHEVASGVPADSNAEKAGATSRLGRSRSPARSAAAAPSEPQSPEVLAHLRSQINACRNELKEVTKCSSVVLLDEDSPFDAEAMRKMLVVEKRRLANAMAKSANGKTEAST